MGVCLLVYLCVVCIPCALGNQKKTLVPLDMELWLEAIMWVLGIKPRSAGRAAGDLHH